VHLNANVDSDLSVEQVHTPFPAGPVLWHPPDTRNEIHCSAYHIKYSSQVWLKHKAKKAQVSDSELKWAYSQPIK